MLRTATCRSLGPYRPAVPLEMSFFWWFLHIQFLDTITLRMQPTPQDHEMVLDLGSMGHLAIFTVMKEI